MLTFIIVLVMTSAAFLGGTWHGQHRRPKHNHHWRISSAKFAKVTHIGVRGEPTGVVTDATQILMTCICGEFLNRRVDGKWTKAELEGWAELEGIQ